MINVNIRKSFGKKAQKNLWRSISAAVWQIGYTRVRSHMYTLQMYSWRIKLEVIFFLSLSLIRKEGDQISARSSFTHGVKM